MQLRRGGHQEPFHGPRGANEDLEEQIAFTVSQSKGCSCFLKCLKKGKRNGLLLFLNTSLICWKMALKALNNLPTPGTGSGTHANTRGKAKVYGPSLHQVGISYHALPTISSFHTLYEERSKMLGQSRSQ